MPTREFNHNGRTTSMKGVGQSDIARHWNAGEAGCGSLIMGLKRQMGLIGPGELLKVTALDSAAPIDIAAWCDMTGHKLTAKAHPEYILKRKNG